MFKFKQFAVKHEVAGIKVGTDAVLLGAWTEVNNIQAVLDVGTGCGIIALMLAQRSSAEIVAIDIYEEAVNEARSNFKRSKWNQRLAAIHISFQDFIKASSSKFDLIICNPPFFINSLKPENYKKILAKHDETLNFETLCFGAHKLLTENGTFNLIIPHVELNRFVAAAIKYGFYIAKQTNVITVKGQHPKRVLLQLTLNIAQKQMDTLILQNEDYTKTKEFAELTKHFYL